MLSEEKDEPAIKKQSKNKDNRTFLDRLQKWFDDSPE